MDKKTDKYICLEEPDKSIIVDFLGTNSRRIKDRRACNIQISVENGKLWVYARGCDDRATILIDMVVDLPEQDRRS